MTRSKLGELQLKLLVERVQARTTVTAQQDISDDAAAVPVKKNAVLRLFAAPAPNKGARWLATFAPPTRRRARRTATMVDARRACLSSTTGSS